MKKYIISLLLLLPVPGARAQDSVDVTFRYQPTRSSPGIVYLSGEFNGWTVSAAASAMKWDPSGRVWTRTVRLRKGYSGGIYGAYQYKFNEDGTTWLPDPLNPRTNPRDNNNSYLYINDPTIYQFVPNQNSGIIRTSTPVVSAYIFPKVGALLDTSSLSVLVDARAYSGVGKYYDRTSGKFTFQIPDPVSNGSHSVQIRIGNVADSVTISVQAGAVRITNVGGFTTRNPLRTLFGALDDTSIHSVRVIRNDSAVTVIPASNGAFSFVAVLNEGINTFKATIGDASGGTKTSDPVSYTHFVNHAPNAVISYLAMPTQVVLSALSSTDPDAGQGGQLSFVWSADAGNPEPSFSGTLTQPSVTIQRPKTPGDYAFTLIATDPSGLKDTTRSFFSILDDGSFQNPTLATVPRWAKCGRMYELFFKSLTPAGTINAALPYLPYFKNLGVSILWVMPVMTNAAPMNNESGTGYNIKDFFTVAPEYGTNDDFRDFVSAAHRLGLKVILDVTPNHTSYVHPFVVQGRQYHENSPYWTFYQHTIIPHNDNGVGPQILDHDGYVYYSAFSSQLLNYNWSDIDARTYMIEAYKWWIKEFDIDGYRFDVYWGPRRRANNGAGGENEMGDPVRLALKHVKADILLLAEDDGTGVGTEVIFGDRSGGVDAGYDWQLYGNAIKPFYSKSIDVLNNYITNFGGSKMGFIPGPNAMFMRFLENHDEERIVSRYGSYEKTMPIGTAVFTAPGLPMVYSGQEVGFGLGVNGYDQRRRGVIDWNAPGKALLTPHYQRLALIRQQFKAFSTQRIVRVATGNPAVYAFTRPYPEENGVVLVNVSDKTQNSTVYLNRTNMDPTKCTCQDHFGNDLYNDTTFIISYVDSQLVLSYSLKPYGSAVFVVSDTIERLDAPLLVSVNSGGTEGASVTTFRLDQNYPNPFNPTTTISYQLASESAVSLKVFNILGEEVATLVDGRQTSGFHLLQWNGRDRNGVRCSSGVYFLRLEAGGFAEVKRMLLLK